MPTPHECHAQRGHRGGDGSGDYHSHKLGFHVNGQNSQGEGLWVRSRRRRTRRQATISRNRVAVFLGAPGVGKGTYASRVCRQLGLRHVVAGDLIRAEIAAGSAIGNQVRAASQAGKLVDDRIVTSLVATALHTALSTESCAGVVLDGFLFGHSLWIVYIYIYIYIIYNI